MRTRSNRSSAFLIEAARLGIAVDVASAPELAAAERAGFAAPQIEATGPKGERLLRRLVSSGVTINVDNPWELETIIRLTAALGDRPTPLLLRVSGFTGGAVSRFGVPVAECRTALAPLARHADLIDFEVSPSTSTPATSALGSKQSKPASTSSRLPVGRP